MRGDQASAEPGSPLCRGREMGALRLRQLWDTAGTAGQPGELGAVGPPGGAQRGVGAGHGEVVRDQGCERGWSCCTGPRTDKGAAAGPGSRGRGGDGAGGVRKPGGGTGPPCGTRSSHFTSASHVGSVTSEDRCSGWPLQRDPGLASHPSAPTPPLGERWNPTAPEEGQEE